MAENSFEVFRTEVIHGLYDRLLLRQPGPEEVDYWASYLKKNSFAQTYDAFLDSIEFKAKQGVTPGHPIGHYYSPVINPAEIDVEKMEADLSQEDLRLIGVSLAKMTTFWDAHNSVIASAPFPRSKTPDRRFYLENPVFSFADALMLRAMLLVFKPRRVIEIGSGFSSAVMLDTAEEASLGTRFTFVDPYPSRLQALLRPHDNTFVEIFAKPIQQLGLEIFDELGQDDMVFIDSTHVLKSQSDVCHELFEILPRLKDGVIIHFHDIFYPFEYPKAWIIDRKYSWNEAYALRLFLMYNAAFEIVFFNNMFGKFEKERIASSCPLYLEGIGGSLWMKKKQAPGSFPGHV